MQSSQLGAQLYTVREHLQNLSAFSQTIDRLQKIGYRAVELIPSDTLTDSDTAKVCRDAGITIAAAHVPGPGLIAHPEKIVEKLQILETKIAVYAFPAGVDFHSRQEVEQLAHQLNQSAEILRQAGFTLAYHNHALEFYRCEGELVFDTIRRIATRLFFELDPYWTQYAGMNPEHWIRTLGNKLVCLHLKDFGVTATHGELPLMAEVGYGNLDFAALIAAAEQADCNWFIVEQDITPGDPFDSLATSFRYVTEHLISPAKASGISRPRN